MTRYISEIMAVKGLIVEAKATCKEFGIELPMISFNNRLKTTAGRYAYNSHGHNEIELSGKYFRAFGYDRSLLTLKHELAHAYIIQKKIRVVGGAHGKTFQRVCKEFGGSMNTSQCREMNREDNETRYIKTSYKHKYTCPNCDTSVSTKGALRRFHGRTCAKCCTPLKNWKHETL